MTVRMNGAILLLLPSVHRIWEDSNRGCLLWKKRESGSVDIFVFREGWKLAEWVCFHQRGSAAQPVFSVVLSSREVVFCCILFVAVTLFTCWSSDNRVWLHVGETGLLC